MTERIPNSVDFGCVVHDYSLHDIDRMSKEAKVFIPSTGNVERDPNTMNFWDRLCEQEENANKYVVPLVTYETPEKRELIFRKSDASFRLYLNLAHCLQEDSIPSCYRFENNGILHECNCYNGNLLDLDFLEQVAKILDKHFLK